MLSTEVRQKVEFICQRIAKGEEVQFKDMEWIQKWAKSNHSVDAMLRKARREGIHGAFQEGTLDDFMQKMDLGDPDPATYLSGAQDPVTLAEWFAEKRKWFRGTGAD
jgi:predicted lactoylglutathione lyase